MVQIASIKMVYATRMKGKYSVSYAVNVVYVSAIRNIKNVRQIAIAKYAS